MVMDMSFANQSLSVLHLTRVGKTLEKKVYPVPKEIDEEIARLKLASMGVAIDKLLRGPEEVPRGLERRDLSPFSVGIAFEGLGGIPARSAPRRLLPGYPPAAFARRSTSDA